jgi:hypothetical protein
VNATSVVGINSLASGIARGPRASAARGVSLKNVAQGGDRRVGDWDPRGAHQDEFPKATFFRGVEQRPMGNAGRR